jgi:tRNA modification GTPase
MSVTTIAAIATPPGRGGVGIIRLSGPSALSIAITLTGLSALSPRHAHFTTWWDADGEAIDQGITLLFPAPHSYTGEDVIELQAHGSPVLLRALLERVFDLGAVPAQPGEFTRRAVFSGKMDLSQAEAVAACIDAATLRAARQAQRHLEGELSRKIEALMHELTGLVANVEACLDFPEEDIPAPLYATMREQAETSLLQPMLAMLDTARFGERLFDGAHVAIIGAPNVGKSSLLNRLAGYERAIVSDMAGTTRDVVEIDFEVCGIPVRLLDTAGMHDAGDAIEQEGVRRAHSAASRADAVIFVADALCPDTWTPPVEVDIRLMNKIDRAENMQIPEDFLPVSAYTGAGIEVFQHELAQLLGDADWSGESLLVTRERHRSAIANAAAAIRNGLAMLGEEDKLDLVALEWRQAWASLGEILGLGDVEHLLDRIFSDFCIGK